MIHKIEKLVSIGKFRNFQASGDIAFKPLTLIYADNGSGKTTLTSIFRSLAENDPVIVFKRVSNASILPQSAHVIEKKEDNSTVNHSFRSTGWNHSLPELEVFDIHFINENIYTGFDFTDNHKKRLHHFIIGSQGVTVKKQIEDNKNQKQELRKQIDSNIEHLIKEVENGLTVAALSSFIKIKPKEADSIIERIATARTTLSTASQNASIQKFQLLKHINKATLPFNLDAIKEDLSKTIDSIQEQALEQLFENHCNNLSKSKINSPESWLKTGFNYLNFNPENKIHTNKNCPFCAQPIDELALIKAYSQKFNELFNAFISRLSNYLEALQKFDVCNFKQGFESTRQLNNSFFNQWDLFLQEEVKETSFKIIPSSDSLISALTDLKTCIENKLRNSGLSLNGIESDILKGILAETNNNIDDYNLFILEFNEKADSFRKKIITVQQAEKELQNLLLIEARFGPSVKLKINELLSQKKELAQLDTTYKELVQKEEQEALSFFERYGTEINHFLKIEFKTPFEIASLNHIRPTGKSKESKVGYELLMHGQPIKFDTSEINSVKECLSEGDKSTIALAFFLAKLNLDEKRADKVIIFDDPLSSFDQSRRFATVYLLTILFSQVKQMIVLSHNSHFLYELLRNTQKNNRKTLIINEDIPSNSSRIEEIDLESLVEPEYFQHTDELIKFSENPTLDKKERALGLIRNVLEAHLRFRFYRQLSRIPAESRTFGKVVETLARDGVALRNSSDTQLVFDRLKVLNSISCKPHHGEGVIDYSQLGIHPETITLRELHEFVKETLDLIENKI